MTDTDLRALLDVELAPIVDAMPAFTLSADALPSIREALAFEPDTSEGVVRTEHVVRGDPPVPVTVYRSADADGPVPCVISLHGGGFVLGSKSMDTPLFNHWCTRFSMVGVSVDYRLAPEAPYPAPLDDCYAALAWVFDRAEELGIDTTRIGVRGLSAGGGLAAGLGLLARDRGEFSVAFQLLDSPMLDDRQTTPSSQLEGLAIWTRESNEFGWCSYLGALSGHEDVAHYAAPARATDLAGLPPTMVVVGALDGFVDEDVEFALKLNAARVPTELHVYAGAPHGYAELGVDAEVCRRSRDEIDGWLGRQVQPDPERTLFTQGLIEREAISPNHVEGQT